MQGLHLTADLFDCACSRELLTDRGVLQELCVRLVRGCGLTVVGDDFHRFADSASDPGGVTGLVLLAESHLAVHTWPELNSVTLDVYVCNFRQDNTSRAQSLTDALVNLFLPQLLTVETFSMGINVGLERVRFPSPVRVGDSIRGRGEVVSAAEVGGGVQVVVRIGVDVAGSDKRCCVADTVSRFIP